MSVLITGGAGFLGGYLVDRLLGSGQSIRVLLKEGEEPRNCWKDIECVRGNLLDPPSLRRALQGARTVYHLAADLRLSQDAYIVNHRGTENLLSVCSGFDLERFLFFSSVSVIGEARPGRLDEHSPCLPANLYARSKYMAEQAVLRAGSEGKLPVTVVRPSIAFGPRESVRQDTFLALMRAISNRQFRTIGRKPAIANYVYVRDVVEAAEFLASRSESIGQVFHVTDPCPLQEFVGFAARLLGSPPPGRAPLLIAYPLALLMEAASALTRRPMPLSRARIRALTNPAEFVSDKLRRIHRFSFGWQEGLRRTLSTYKDRGLLASGIELSRNTLGHEQDQAG